MQQQINLKLAYLEVFELFFTTSSCSALSEKNLNSEPEGGSGDSCSFYWFFFIGLG